MNTFLISGILNGHKTFNYHGSDILFVEILLDTGSGRKKLEVRFVGDAKNRVEEYDLDQLTGTLVAIDGYIGAVNLPERRPYVNLCGTKLYF